MTRPADPVRIVSRTSLSWRAAHHWLRGYSDAKAGKESTPLSEECANQYGRGFSVGSGVLPEPALSTSGRLQCQA